MLAPLGQCAVDAGVFVRACCYQEKARGPPGVEAPAEHALIELARTRNIIGVNIKMGDIVCNLAHNLVLGRRVVHSIDSKSTQPVRLAIKCRNMQQKRQTELGSENDSIMVRSLAVGYSPGYVIHSHSHDWGQL